jgi:hypothetical protein
MANKQFMRFFSSSLVTCDHWVMNTGVISPTTEIQFQLMKNGNDGWGTQELSQAGGKPLLLHNCSASGRCRSCVRIDIDGFRCI